MNIEKAIREIDWYLTANPLCSSQERYYEFKNGLAEALKILKMLNNDEYICEKCGKGLMRGWNWCPWCRWETRRNNRWNNTTNSYNLE